MALGKDLVRGDVISRKLLDELLGEMRGRYPVTLRPSLGPLLLKKAPEISRQLRSVLRDSERRWSNPDLLNALDAINSGESILFVGAGFSLDADRPSKTVLSGRTIRRRLINLLQEPGAIADKHVGVLSRENLSYVAQVFENVISRNDLILELERRCAESLPVKPPPQHKILASLDSFRFIVTTNWDRLIEAAFAARGKQRLDVVNRSQDINRLNLSRTTLIKLYGDFDHVTRRFAVEPKVTQRDFMEFHRTEPAMFHLLQVLFAAHPIIVIGFRPDDYNYQRLLDLATADSPDRKHPVFVVDPEEHLAALSPWPQAKLIHASGAEFFEWVKAYVDNRGTETGVAYHPSLKKHRGPIRIWAQEACDLAGRVRERFRHLTRVDIVRPGLVENGDAKQMVARRGAQVVRECTRPAATVAMSCGSTLTVLVEAARPDWEEFRGVRLLSTSIPAFEDCSATAPLSLIAALAKKLDVLGVEGRAYQLPGGFVKYLADRRLQPYLGGPGEDATDLQIVIDEYLSRVYAADVFVLGVGQIGDERTGYYRYAQGCLRECGRFEDEASILQRYLDVLRDELGCVGDVMYLPFRLNPKSKPKRRRRGVEDLFLTVEQVVKCLRKSGDGLNARFKEFLCHVVCDVRTVAPDALRNATRDPKRTVALVAAGRNKAEALTALCREKVGDVLVVDSELAEGILELDSERT